MVGKDQTIGDVICAVCVIIGVLYTAGLFYFGNPFGWGISFTLIAIPVFIAFIAIMAIGTWIGWTMATTPPPKPIEEITSELEMEEKKAAQTEKEEEKKTERKRKSGE